MKLHIVSPILKTDNELDTLNNVDREENFKRIDIETDSSDLEKFMHSVDEDEDAYDARVVSSVKENALGH